MGKFKNLAIELEESEKLKAHLDELENHGMAHEIEFLEKETEVIMTKEEERKMKFILWELKRFNQINPENHELIEKALRLFLGDY